MATRPVNLKTLDKNIKDLSKRRDNPLGLKTTHLDSPSSEYIIEKINKLIPQGILPISKVGNNTKLISSLFFTLNIPMANELELRVSEGELSNYFMIAGRTYDAEPIMTVDTSLVTASGNDLYEKPIIVYVKVIKNKPYLYAVNKSNSIGVNLENIPLFIGTINRTGNETWQGPNKEGNIVNYIKCVSEVALGKTWIAGFHPSFEKDKEGGAFLLKDRLS